MSLLRAIDHVQIAMPAGREGEARGFYGGLLGLAEVEKPVRLAARGGAWFEAGPVRVHLGVDPDFRPARKAHVAFRVADLAGLKSKLATAGRPVVDDDAIAGIERCYVDDPFGNRLELIAEEAGRGRVGG